MSVVQLAEAKTHLNTSGTSDAELQKFIDRAEKAIGKRIGPIGSVTKTERTRGGCATLRLNHSPIISLTSVTAVGGAAIATSQLTALSGGRVVYTQGGWFAARFYDVVYQAGRATLDEDLTLAVLEMVRHLFDTQRGGGAARIGSAPDETMANTVPGAASVLPFRVEQLIAPYVPVLGA